MLMSSGYIISPVLLGDWPARVPSPDSPPAFQLNPDDYGRKILSRWPNSTQVQMGNPLTWWLNELYVHGIEVMLHDDWQHVSIGGHGVNFVDFMLWHRSLIDADCPLYAYNFSDMREFVLQ